MASDTTALPVIHHRPPRVVAIPAPRQAPPTTTPAERRPARSASLDGLRGIAIVLVVVRHLVAAQGDTQRFLHGGFLGVDLFFVLSGYVITMSLLNETRRRGTVRLRLFYARRVLRLWPALLLFGAADLAYVAFTHGDVRAELAGWPWILGFLTNWRLLAGGTVGWALAPLWSLAIEEQFYLVWPSVYVAFRKFRTGLLAVVVAGAAVAAFARIATWQARGHSAFADLYLRTDVRADALLIGVALALLPAVRWRRTGWLRVLASLAVVAFAIEVALATPEADWLYRGGCTLVALTAGVLVYAAGTIGWGGSLLRNPLLVVIGRGSYAIYLWNLAVIGVTWQLGARLAVEQRIWIAVGGTVLAATLSYLLVERPMLRVKERLVR